MSSERPSGFLGLFHRSKSEFEVTTEELAERLRAGPPVSIIDCREPFELSRGRIDPSEHIPLGQVAGQVDHFRELAATADLIIVCGHGQRSLHAARFLRNEGIANAWSLAGGMRAWNRARTDSA